MNPIGHHVMLRLFDDRVIAPTAVMRRFVARAILRIGARYRVAAFGLVDTHLHVILLCDYLASGKFVRGLTRALHHRLRPGAPFQQARRKPIADQQHLYAAFRYVLRQEQHHGVEPDPLREGSALPDLLGARVIGTHVIDVVRAHLPRIRRAELLELLGAGDFEQAAPDPSALAAAAIAAFALPNLESRRRDAYAARRAAVHAAAGLTTKAIATALGISACTVRRMRHASVPSSHRRAVELQLRLHGARSLIAKQGDATLKAS